MKKVGIALLGLVVLVGLFGAATLWAIYAKYTPEYIDGVAASGADTAFSNSIAGIELGQHISSAKIKSCTLSKPPCLWVEEEFNRAVAYKGNTPVAPDYARPKGGSIFTATPVLGMQPPPAGWDSAMDNYFRPRPSKFVRPVTSTLDELSGEQDWIVEFKSDKPLGWRGLDLRVSTCNGVVTSLDLSVPLISESRYAVEPLAASNPIFELAVGWFGQPDSTEVHRRGFDRKSSPAMFYIYAQESYWIQPDSHFAEYRWFEGNPHSGAQNPPYTIHYISLRSQPREKCVSKLEQAKSEVIGRAKEKTKIELERYMMRDEAAVAADNAIFD